MKDNYFCPECHNPLERLSGCGAVGYFCNTCKILISKQKMLTYEEVKERDYKIKNIEHENTKDQ